MQRFCPDGNFLFRAMSFHFPWLLQSWRWPKVLEHFFSSPLFAKEFAHRKFTFVNTALPNVACSPPSCPVILKKLGAVRGPLPSPALWSNGKHIINSVVPRSTMYQMIEQ